MRRSIGWITLTLAATLFSVGLTHAQESQGRVVNTKPNTPTTATAKTEQGSDNSGAANAGADAKASTAEESTGTVIRTHEDLDVTPEEKQRAAAAQAAAQAEEQKIASQLRGLQALMQKEEQDLAKRLAYAGKIREQGLTKNDQKLLDQAEALERQALDYYLKRIKQFEAYSVQSSSSRSTVRPSTSNSRSTSSSRSSRSTTQSSSRYRTRR